MAFRIPFSAMHPHTVQCAEKDRNRGHDATINKQRDRGKTTVGKTSDFTRRQQQCQRHANIQNRNKQESDSILRALLMVKHKGREEEEENGSKNQGDKNSLKHCSYSLSNVNKL
jgi:hypothetical protein